MDTSVLPRPSPPAATATLAPAFRIGSPRAAGVGRLGYLTPGHRGWPPWLLDGERPGHAGGPVTGNLTEVRVGPGLDVRREGREPRRDDLAGAPNRSARSGPLLEGDVVLDARLVAHLE